MSRVGGVVAPMARAIAQPSPPAPAHATNGLKDRKGAAWRIEGPTCLGRSAGLGVWLSFASLFFLCEGLLYGSLVQENYWAAFFLILVLAHLMHAHLPQPRRLRYTFIEDVPKSRRGAKILVAGKVTWIVPEKYSRTQTSNLTATVGNRSNEINFDLPPAE